VGRVDPLSKLIYRVVGESTVWVWSEESGAVEAGPGPGPLAGAFTAQIAQNAWDDLPMPYLTNPRVRFWFTERGWRAYGLAVAAAARASGRPYRVIRRKNPSRSTVVYRDEWQVALLPDRD
jgi:hypothetical protein